MKNAKLDSPVQIRLSSTQRAKLDLVADHEHLRPSVLARSIIMKELDRRLSASGIDPDTFTAEAEATA